MDYRKYIKNKKEAPERSAPGDAEQSSQGSTNVENLKKFLGVRFECCGVYTRAYRNKAGTAYIAHCPRCARSVTIKIDPKRGTSARFFVAK